MNTANRHTFIYIITCTLIVSSVATLTQTSVQAGWFKNTVNSIKKEVKNCTSGGCDPTRATPGGTIKTITGARAVGAATDRWLNRQVRVQGAKVNEFKQRFIDKINNNAECMELPGMEGVCSELNSFHGLNMRIKRISWEALIATNSSKDINYLRNCVNKPGIAFDSPESWSCVNMSNYTE